jgi:hypothetical protein
MLAPAVFSVAAGKPALAAVTFGICGVALAADAAVRRLLNLAYLAMSAFTVVVWALLQVAKVSEPQAYVIPLGLELLAVGWNERGQGRRWRYQLATRIGLVILMGSAFVQSTAAASYALLLLGESLAAFYLGVRTRSRGYVQLALLSLILNAIAQIGPAFAALDRWIQIGAVGVILLGGGMAALFRRERILTARHAISDEWKRWEP